MKKTKDRRNKPHKTELEKFIYAFMKLARNLFPRDRAELSRLIVVVLALVTQTYLLVWVLTLVLNRP